MSIFSPEEASINNLLNAGSSIRGNVRITGFMRVDGDIDGNLECSGAVIVGEKARIRGNITARSVTVSGIVLGDIWAPEGIYLTARSVVLGDVQTHNLKADEGIVLNGHCISLKDDAAYSEASEHWQNAKAISAKAFRA